MQYILILSEVIFGGYFVMGGINHFTHLNMMAGYSASKHVPSPKLAVALSGAMIIIGGLFIMFASVLPVSLKDIGVILIILFLVPVTFTMHNFWTIQDPMARMSDRVNFMKNIAILAAALAYLFV